MMSIELNHTIVGASDKDASARFLADIGFRQAGEINTRWGGRGRYVHDPDGHSMELLTRAP